MLYYASMKPAIKKTIIISIIALAAGGLGYLGYRAWQTYRTVSVFFGDGRNSGAAAVSDLPQVNPYADTRTNPFEEAKTNPFKDTYQNPFAE